MATMITASELASMRRTLQLALPDSCTIQTRSEVADGYGGITETWTNSYSNVPCRVTLLQQTGVVEGNQFEHRSTWVVTVGYNQPLAAGNRIVHRDVTYEVMTVQDYQTDRVSRRADLRRID